MKKIVVNPQFESLHSFIETLPATFDSTGIVIFKGRNILKRYEVKERSLIVKRFKVPHIINRIAYVTFRSSKAARSYENALKLSTLGVETPQPIAYVEEYFLGLAYSYYVTSELKNMTEIREIHSVCSEEEAMSVLTAFGQYTAGLHKKGILHKDYSPGNILFGIEKGQIHFSIVDINRLLWEPVTEEAGYKNFERLWLSDSDFVTVASSYASSMGYDVYKAVERICFYKDRFMKH